MSEVVGLEVGSGENLQAFSKYLWEQGVSHRVVRIENKQLLLVGNQQVARQLRSAYEAWQAGEEQLPSIELPETPAPTRVFKGLLRHLPVTLSLVALSVLGFAIVALDKDFGLVKYLTFFNFERSFDLDGGRAQLIFSIPAGEYWRLITPIFLHFGLLHVAFNMALLWFVGQRIELLKGSFWMLGIVLVIGLGSNIIQAVMSGAAIFGGMSGVVYGLLGYGWIWSLIRPDQHLQIPSVLLYFSLFMLVMGFVGAVDLLGAGRVANAAHLGGLIMGCVIGLGAGLISKSSA